MADIVLLTGVTDVVFQRAIGAYRIASHLRQHGYSAQVIDFLDNFEKEELLDTIDKFVDSNTKVIAISTTFLQQGQMGIGPRTKRRRISDMIESVLKELRIKYPTIKLVAGGANGFAYQEDGLFDAIITGYGEGAILEYIDNLKNNVLGRIWPVKNGTQIINGDSYSFDVQNFKHQWTEADCILEGETLPIEISRGCIFRCKFCSYPLNGKKKLDYLRHFDRLKEELIHNYENFGVTNYFFGDDTFNDSMHKLEVLHELFTSLPFKIKFVAYIRLDLLYAYPQQIPMLKEMGLATAAFGIETLKEETAKFIGKGLAADKIKEFLPKLYNEYWNKEIPVICSFILGLPYETIDEMRDSFNWIKTTGMASIWLPLMISPDAFYKSDIDINYEKYGYKLNPDRSWENGITSTVETYALAHEFAVDSLHKNQINTWLLMSLLSYKEWSIEELAKLTIGDMAKMDLQNRKNNAVLEYKKKLQNVANGRMDS